MQVEDPSTFYGATATILSAVLIAGVLELRWYREFSSRQEGRPALIDRVILTLFAVLLCVAALMLGSIPSAALNGPSKWYEDPELLAHLTSGVVTIAIVFPLGTYLALVWLGRFTHPPSAPLPPPGAKSAPVTSPVPSESGTHRAASCGVLVVAAFFFAQRWRKR